MNSSSRLAVWWPLVFGVSIGTELMLTTLTLFGPERPDPKVSATLTLAGLSSYAPERDVGIYIKGCMTAAALILLLAFIWKRRADREDEAARPYRAKAQIGVCLALFLIHLVILFVTRWSFVLAGFAVPMFFMLLLYLPPCLSLAITTVAWRWIPFDFSNSKPLKNAAKRREVVSSGKETGRLWLDILVPLLLAAIIYIPSYRNLAGHCYLGEEFHHWNFFAMAPTLAFRHGGALCTDYYSQYGVGWPLLLNALSVIIPISYGGMIHLAVLYGCIYYVGVYWLLRLLTGRSDWAAAGVFFALVLQLFHGSFPNDPLWRFPSSSIVRSMMDVWFFIALVLHIRSRRSAWALLAGTLVGLGILLETDTGIYLAATFLGYWTYSFGLKTAPRLGRLVLLAMGSFAVAGSILITGLYVASRGTLLHKAFWTGWLETFISFGAGFMMIPVAVVPDGTLLLLTLFLVVYLAGMAPALINLIQKESSDGDVLLGTISSYGIVVLLLFIGRSHPFNIYHVAVPFGIVTCVLASRLVPFAVMNSGSRQMVSRTKAFQMRLIPIGALACCLFWLWVTPAFKSYPSAIKTLLGGEEKEGLCLFDQPHDVCGLPANLKNYIAGFHALTQCLRDIHASGKSVAILDNADTVYYYASDIPPWTRYSPSFAAVGTRSALLELKERLESSGPDFVAIRDNAARARAENAQDVWSLIHKTVETNYTLQSKFGAFELWQRNKG